MKGYKMLELLKAERAGTLVLAQRVREAERHALKQARYLRGYPDGHKITKKHLKDHEKPKIPTISEMQKKVLEREDTAKNLSEEEKKFWNMHTRRKNIIQKYSRHLHLAYMFLRGRSMTSAEVKNNSYPVWSDIEQMVVLFSEEDERKTRQEFAAWKDEALEYYGRAVGKKNP